MKIERGQLRREEELKALHSSFTPEVLTMLSQRFVCMYHLHFTPEMIAENERMLAEEMRK